MRKCWFAISVFALAVSLAPATTLADSLGDQVSFRVDPEFDSKGRSELFASLRLVTDQLYFYVEDDWWGGLQAQEQEGLTQALGKLGASFENEIYPGVTSIFGTENRPGIDGDVRMTVLLHRMRDQMKGYFNTGDGYSTFESPGSNEREMMYLSEGAVASELTRSYLAHEFLHLVYFNQKQIRHNTRDEIWIQEGFAELGPTLVGYDDPYEGSYLEKRVRDFVSDPRDSLVEWRGLAADYGSVNIFFQYLLDQYGEEFLADAMQSSAGGIASLEQALQSRGISKSFSDVFTDWMIAVFLNDCAYGKAYCFENENLKRIRVAPFTNFLSSFGETQLTVSNETKNWAGNWHRIAGGKGELEVEFSGNPHVGFRVPYLVEDTNGQYRIDAFVLTEEQTGKIAIPKFGSQNQAVIILPSVHHQLQGFDRKNPSYFFSWTVFTNPGNGNSGLAVSGAPEPSSDAAFLLSQIASLQAEVARLQEQLRLLTSGGLPGAVSCTFGQNLSFGTASVQDVRCLQEFLKQQGSAIYPEGLVTGNFLSLTRSAVIRFQEAHAADILAPLGLKGGTGFVGPATRTKIQELVREQQLVFLGA